QAVCGLRLSDRTMRHRPYKREHLPASLRPTVAAAMVRLAGIAPESVVLDPMCGVGTILAEAAELARQRRASRVILWGGGIERPALAAAAVNLKPFHPDLLIHWDARRLPLPAASVDRVISNPPFGRQLGEPHEIATLYRLVVAECDRVVKPGGRAACLVGDAEPLLAAVRPITWSTHKQVRVRILGLPALIGVWRKADVCCRMAECQAARGWAICPLTISPKVHHASIHVPVLHGGAKARATAAGREKTPLPEMRDGVRSARAEGRRQGPEEGRGRGSQPLRGEAR